MLEKQSDNLRFHVVQFHVNSYIDGQYDPDLGLQSWLNENIPANANLIILERLLDEHYRVVYEIKKGMVGR